MDHPKFIVLNQKQESISIQMFRYFIIGRRVWEWNNAMQ